MNVINILKEMHEREKNGTTEKIAAMICNPHTVFIL